MAAADECSSPVPTDEQGAPEWEENATACGDCAKAFTLMRRKHHCRGCGRTFCDSCSSKRHEMPPAFKTIGPQRVCNGCFFVLRQEAVLQNPGACPPPDYTQVHDQLLAKLQDFLKNNPPELWKQRVKTKECAIYTRRIENSALLCVRSEITINVPHRKVLQFYTKLDNWPKWQADVLEIRLVEKLEDASFDSREVCYCSYKLPVVDNRDAALYNCVLNPHDHQLPAPKAADRAMIGCSVDHPLTPSMKGFVRAIITMSYTLFEAIDDKTTKLTTIMHSDPRGLLPPKLINMGLARATEQMEAMARYMEENQTTLS